MRGSAAARRALAVGGIAGVLAGLGLSARLLVQAEGDWQTVRRLWDTPPGSSAFRLRDEDGALSAFLPTSDRYLLVNLEAVDPRFLADVVAVEDAEFYTHGGVRWDAVAGAALLYIGRGSLRLIDLILGTRLAPNNNIRGGSTITQQLVKNMLGNPPRTARVKIREIYATVRLEAMLRDRYPDAEGKQRILERYLNEIYAAPGLRGIRAASWVLHDRQDLRTLDAEARSALLAGIQAPAALREGRERSRELLARTRAKVQYLSPEPQKSPFTLPLDNRVAHYRDRMTLFARQSGDAATIPYARVMRTLLPRHAAGSVDVRTCRDAQLDRELNGLLAQAIVPYRGPPCTVLGAFALLRLSDGAVLAVGDSGCGVASEAILARRQILSTFKPFLYARALQELNLTPASVFVDRRYTVRDRLGRPYAPGNHYAIFKGPVTLKTALQHSTNTVSLQLLDRMSVHSVVGVGQELFRLRPKDRLRDRFHADFALALGAVQLSPLELAAGYLSLLSGGRKRYPRLRCDRPQLKGRVVLDPRASAQVREMLTAVVRWEGTAALPADTGSDLIIQDLGGKSGSSERDSWFVGFSEDLLLVTWLGAATGKDRLPPTVRAATLWRSLMARTTRAFPPRKLEHSKHLRRDYYCRRTGLRPGPACRLESALFAPGQQPAEICPHSRPH